LNQKKGTSSRAHTPTTTPPNEGTSSDTEDAVVPTERTGDDERRDRTDDRTNDEPASPDARCVNGRRDERLNLRRRRRLGGDRHLHEE
jgi:hypothetical protein